VETDDWNIRASILDFSILSWDEIRKVLYVLIFKDENNKNQLQ